MQQLVRRRANLRRTQLRVSSYSLSVHMCMCPCGRWKVIPIPLEIWYKLQRLTVCDGLAVLIV